MTRTWIVDVAFAGFSVLAVLTGWRVFRTDSMVRATFYLLASFLNVACIMLLLVAEYLGLALFFMMAVEMTVMAIFMVAFMMNPAGLNPMEMVHQKRAAIASAWVVFAALAGVGLLASFPSDPLDPAQAADTIRALGRELLGDSMLVFESAGVTLLATMVGAIALSSHHHRHGRSDEGSVPPPLDPEHPDDEQPEVTGHAHGEEAP